MKVAKLGFAVAAVAMASIPAMGLLTDSAAASAVAHDDEHGAHAEAAAGTDATAAGATAAPVDAGRIAKGRELFDGWSCSACHTLAAAEASGAVGPSLDGSGLTEEFIVSRITDGQGAMPGFGGQLTTEEIADLSYYLTKVAAK
jgi:mono/diheme cytochrome c family protein